MARPTKKGLEYFPFDVDFFNDEKIEAISGEFGIKGEIVAIKLLTAVYRNGYFVEWSEMLQMKMLKSLPSISKVLLEQILSRLVRWDFFDENLFNSAKVLTSKGIQKRYFEATKRCKPSDSLPYLLVNVTKTPVNVAETPVNVTETTQRKEKESKVNKKEKDKKEKESSPHGDTPTKSFKEFNEKEFYETLIPFVKEYGKEMIRSFYDYWTEKNASGKKMRFQLEKTWETAKRLSTWNRNENKFNKEKPQNKVETPKRKVYEL